MRAGGLIETQMRSAEAKRGYAQARLRALWPEIVGTDLAAVTMPVRLARNRGPAGGLLTLAVSGAHAALIQMQLPALRERVNAALGPGTVGRIQLTHAAAGFADAPRPSRRPELEAVELGTAGTTISSIGDDELRAALERLAQNVISRSRRATRV